MLRKLFIRMLISAGLVFAAGCAHCGNAPEFRSQSITTDESLRVDIELTDGSTVKMLVGSQKDVDMPSNPDIKNRQSGASMGVVGHAAATTTFANATGANAAAPVVQQGFIYVVRPPAWPMLRTPASRGGPPMTQTWNGLGYVGASVTDGVQRIFFLGAFDANGNVREGARISVDDFPAHTSNPPAVFLEVGQYAEVRVVGASLEIIVAPHRVTDPECPSDIRSLLLQMRQRAETLNLPWNPAVVVSGGA